jgi:superoxide dismutase, Fe-Mn family
MVELKVDRRMVLGAGALVATTFSAAAQAQPAQPARPATAFQTKPLPFAPGAVPGISEKLMSSHFDNNYAGAVRRLGQIETQLASLDPATAPGFTLNGLKREELLAWNSMILHELYFASLAPNAAPRPGAALGAAIERDFGTHDRWRGEFSGAAKALGGGSGWVILTYSHRDGRLMNQWAADHTMTLAGSTPILAVDMYEHAYHMDYGSRAGEYVDAVMKVLDWRSAEARFAKAAA